MSSAEVLAISLINEALDQGYPEKTLSALLLPAAGLEDVSLQVAPRYHLLLVAAKRKKAKVRLGIDGWVRHYSKGISLGYCPGCTLKLF